MITIKTARAINLTAVINYVREQREDHTQFFGQVLEFCNLKNRDDWNDYNHLFIDESSGYEAVGCIDWSGKRIAKDGAVWLEVEEGESLSNMNHVELYQKMVDKSYDARDIVNHYKALAAA